MLTYIHTYLCLWDVVVLISKPGIITNMRNHMKPFAHNWHLHEDMFSCLNHTKCNIYASARCKQSSGETFLPSRFVVLGYVVPFCLCQSVFDRWIMAESLACQPPLWVAKMALTSRGLGFETTHYRMKQLVHNWYLPCCQCTGSASETRSLHTKQ